MRKPHGRSAAHPGAVFCISCDYATIGRTTRQVLLLSNRTWGFGGGGGGAMISHWEIFSVQELLYVLNLS